ncbi:MAG: hypothetical protein ABI275_09720, partial [Terrimesophilobacter sp.]
MMKATLTSFAGAAATVYPVRAPAAVDSPKISSESGASRPDAPPGALPMGGPIASGRSGIRRLSTHRSSGDSSGVSSMVSSRHGRRVALGIASQHVDGVALG